jgi:hypothetical protein
MSHLDSKAHERTSKRSLWYISNVTETEEMLERACEVRAVLTAFTSDSQTVLVSYLLDATIKY